MEEKIMAICDAQIELAKQHLELSKLIESNYKSITLNGMLLKAILIHLLGEKDGYKLIDMVVEQLNNYAHETEGNNEK